MKTSLGALSKNFVGIELDWPVTLGSVTLVRVKSSHCYLDQQHEIVYEYDKKHSQRLVYIEISRVIFNTLFNIIRVCRSRYVL